MHRSLLKHSIKISQTERGGIVLKKMSWYAQCILAASLFCAAIFVTVMILQPPHWNFYAILAFTAGLIGTVIFFTLSKKLKDAQLIIENQILHIQPAVLRDPGKKEIDGAQPFETIEMFISGFGILLGFKVIKFNQDGIKLKAVEIGRDFISIDYGTDQEVRNIRLNIPPQMRQFDRCGATP